MSTPRTCISWVEWVQLDSRLHRQGFKARLFALVVLQTVREEILQNAGGSFVIDYDGIFTWEHILSEFTVPLFASWGGLAHIASGILLFSQWGCEHKCWHVKEFSKAVKLFQSFLTALPHLFEVLLLTLSTHGQHPASNKCQELGNLVAAFKLNQHWFISSNILGL